MPSVLFCTNYNKYSFIYIRIINRGGIGKYKRGTNFKINQRNRDGKGYKLGKFITTRKFSPPGLS